MNLNSTSDSIRGMLRSVTAALPRARVPSQARAIRTREALLAAGRREFATRGWSATTAKTIAERAKVATGSFYQYFADKDAVLRELASERLAEVGMRTVGLLEAPVDAGSRVQQARARLEQVVDVVLALHRDDPGLHAVFTERRHADAAFDAIWSAGEQALLDRVVALLARWDHPGDRDAVAFVLLGMIEGAIHAHVLGAPRVDDDRLRAALVDALVKIALPLPDEPPRRARPRGRNQE